MTLALYPRLAVSTTGLVTQHDLTAIARDWRRNTRSIGGWWTGSLRITQDDLTRAELIDFYNLNIGCRLQELTGGAVTWEGKIMEMRLTQAGATELVSLRPSIFHNRVRVYYSDTVGGRTATAWGANTDSSAEFGECELIISAGGATGTGALALRDAELTEYAWPRSRSIGGDAVNRGVADQEGPDVLEIIISGYWSTLNCRWRETTITNQASTVVGTLAAASEFVTAGRIETNALSVRADCYHNPQRLGDLIADVTTQGDASGAVWMAGVYEDQALIYEPAPVTWEYQFIDGELYDLLGAPAMLETIGAGFLLYNPNAPTGWTKPGVATDWDDPRICYVDETELIRGAEYDELRLHYYGAAEGTAAIVRRLRRGNI